MITTDTDSDSDVVVVSASELDDDLVFVELQSEEGDLSSEDEDDTSSSEDDWPVFTAADPLQVLGRFILVEVPCVEVARAVPVGPGTTNCRWHRAKVINYNPVRKKHCLAFQGAPCVGRIPASEEKGDCVLAAEDSAGAEQVSCCADCPRAQRWLSLEEDYRYKISNTPNGDEYTTRVSLTDLSQWENIHVFDDVATHT